MDDELEIFETVRTSSPMKRLASFLRSVMPADPYQLVFLLGVIFIFISPRLSWWQSRNTGGAFEEALHPDATDGFRTIFSIAVWPIIIASLVGYYTCFWAGIRLIRRLLLGVLFPASIGMSLMLYGLYRFARFPRSLLDTRSSAIEAFRWMVSNLGNMSVGIYFGFCGLLLLAIFTLRVYLNISTLPLSLDLQGSAETENLSNRYRWLVFTLVGPLFFVASLSSILAAAPYLLRLDRYFPMSRTLSFGVAQIVEGAMAIGVSLAILGRPSAKILRSYIRLPEPRYALLSLLLPVGIGIGCVAVPYLGDRMHWEALNVVRTWPPKLTTYFDLDRLWQPSLLLLGVGAFAEELVFRGFLLRELTRCFNLQRGIFLTGVIWAATHFRTDSYSGQSVGGVLYHIAWRVLSCLAVNYVFSWMTLRWNSVIPSGIAHTVSNILIVSGVTRSVAWSAECEMVLWAGVSLLLYHYWPPKENEDELIKPESVLLPTD